MKMTPAKKVVAGTALGALLLAIAVYLPVNPRGIWTGDAIGCLCPCHNFIQITDVDATYVSENHTRWVARSPVENADWRTWIWKKPEFDLTTTNGSMIAGVITNDVIVRATPLFIQMRLRDGRKWKWISLHRDARSVHAQSVIAAQRGPISAEMLSQAEASIFAAALAERKMGVTNSFNYSNTLAKIDKQIEILVQQSNRAYR